MPLLASPEEIQKFSQNMQDRHAQLAEAIVRYVESKALDIPVASSFASMTAAGARGEVDGRALIIAKPAYFADTLRLDIVAMRPRVEELEAQGKTVVLVGDERAAGLGGSGLSRNNFAHGGGR